ncbi:MAG TPA: molybdopterin molybdenumtransferase MoeA [Cytophagales bacterium]|jgi:molybdopterin molybdotransferase|nr:molybdopterin molybdenumtransferase MoeA [Cytophagales bacterium]
MVSVSEAEKIILDFLFVPIVQSIPIEEAQGKIIAEEIKADRDLPPFNKATMDGIAVSFEQIQKGKQEFIIEGTQAAGQAQLRLTTNENCFEIMTGAPLPIGCDTVIPYENISIQNKLASVHNTSTTEFQNVHAKGSDATQGKILLKIGTRLSPADIAVLASVGKKEVTVFKYPRAAVISTGDELVDVAETPLPHQIRKSNSHALTTSLNQLGCSADQFHLRDNEHELTEKLKSILSDYELIILSGGVSKGKYDFVPQVLESLGVKKLFHGVSQRPGKPMWFGVSQKNFVFALPGNPVSTFMCFHRYVKLWLTKSMGEQPKIQHAILAKDFSFAPSLTYFLQAKIKNENGKLMAYPDAGGGSGDFVNLIDVDGFVELPRKKNEFKAGEVFQLHLFR